MQKNVHIVQETSNKIVDTVFHYARFLAGVINCIEETASYTINNALLDAYSREGSTPKILKQKRLATTNLFCKLKV